MMKKLIFLFFIVNFSYSQSTLMLDKVKSKINYKTKHIFNSWEGVNNDINGVMVYDGVISKIALAAKLIDFDSGNSNRDLQLLESIEILKFPYVKFYSEEIELKGNEITFNGEIEFHGKKKQIKIIAINQTIKNQIKIQGKFQLLLSEFLENIPAFMLFEIENDVTISFELYFDE